jgi:hypothetical protein
MLITSYSEDGSGSYLRNVGTYLPVKLCCTIFQENSSPDHYEKLPIQLFAYLAH